MLVLSRFPDEKVAIKDSFGRLICEVNVVRVSGNKVKLGFEAPNDIRIVRSELPEKPDLKFAGKSQCEAFTEKPPLAAWIGTGG